MEQGAVTESTKKSIRTAIQKLAKTFNINIVEILLATVESVDMTARTCVVTPVTGRSDTTIEDVALTIDQNDGEIKQPSVGSTVGVAISNDYPNAFLIAWSDLDSIVWKGGDYAGLVRVIDLTTKLNNLESKVTALENAMATHNHLSAGSGSPTGPSTGGTPPYIQPSALTPTRQSDIENTLMKHGSK